MAHTAAGITSAEAWVIVVIYLEFILMVHVGLQGFRGRGQFYFSKISSEKSGRNIGNVSLESTVTLEETRII